MQKQVLEAILKGEDVQFKNNPSLGWRDFEPAANDYNAALYSSLFDEKKTPYFEWRIKPIDKKIQYRIALMKGAVDYYVEVINCVEDAVRLETCSMYFVEWISDWITYRIKTDG